MLGVCGNIIVNHQLLILDNRGAASRRQRQGAAATHRKENTITRGLLSNYDGGVFHLGTDTN